MILAFSAFNLGPSFSRLQMGLVGSFHLAPKDGCEDPTKRWWKQHQLHNLKDSLHNENIRFLLKKKKPMIKELQDSNSRALMLAGALVTIQVTRPRSWLCLAGVWKSRKALRSPDAWAQGWLHVGLW